MTSVHPPDPAALANIGRMPGTGSSLAPTIHPFPTWLVIAFRVLTAGLGVAMLVRPHKTLLVVVALFAAQLFLSGAFNVARAVSPWASGAAERVLLAIGGALALLAGLLILRRPLQTVVVVTLLVGAWWIVQGVMDLVTAVLGGPRSRLGSVLLGVLNLVAGMYVLLNPGMSLFVFVWVSGVWMIVAGAVTVVTALQLRRLQA